MQVRVLGPVQVMDDGGLLVELGPKERTVLTRLAAARGQGVARDVLIDCVWRRPPASARKTLHGYLHRIRRVMGAATVVREADAYRLVGVELDIDAVESHVGVARRAVAVGDLAHAVELLRLARKLFRGRPLPELDEDIAASAIRQQLAELEIRITEELFDAELRLGCNPDLLGEIEEAVSRDLTREGLWVLLASGYALADRQADALGAVARARRVLAIELGVEPGSQLRAVEQAILDQRSPLSGVDVRTARPARVSSLPGSLAAWADDVPFVGRRDSWAQLRDAFDAVISTHRPHVDLIIGEAGVGKTRLAAQLARSLHARGVTVLFGRCSEATRTAYQPLQQVFEQLATIPPTAASTDPVHGLKALLDRLASDSPTIKASTPEADRYDLFQQMTRVIEQAAAEHPVLVVLDDLHWAAVPTMLALDHLVRASMRAALMIVATVRAPEFGGTDVFGILGTLPGVRALRLAGFDLDGVRDYLGAVGADGLDLETTAQTLLSRTGGNAFMIGEIVRSNSVGFDPSSVSVPDLVRDVLVARARRLPEPTFELLRLASLIGLEFELEVLIRAAGIDEAIIIDSMEAAVATQLVVEGTTGFLGYRFRHAIVRDALSATMTRSRQAPLHRQIAGAIEAFLADRSLPTIVRLAHHFLLASGVAARRSGCGYAETAGDLSHAAYAYEDACAWFARALSADAEAGTEPVRACRLQLAIARSATLAGNQTRARTQLRR